MAGDSIKKTVLITPFGLFEFVVTPFSLKNASATIQEFMNGMLGDLKLCVLG